MTQSWMSLLNLGSEKFPIEVFGYPEESPADAVPIWYQLITSPEATALPKPMPKQRMRMKIVCADGAILDGEERHR